jgi:hypothetical protein
VALFPVGRICVHRGEDRKPQIRPSVRQSVVQWIYHPAKAEGAP